ncbi:GTA-gp10 family protein [uncultured Sulfitobacter sp.]|uniref:GTA-gp10 family protein n=1 Tax=uncultured Sulfitobacter sp. TaxID=191468 RepID=UPI0030DD6100|tara:strand:+ start:464 stop:889 length:426 start_codon:yes stop_codon:yes gene_type:complete
MPITADAPLGGTLEQLGGESRPLILRNGEIERFERQHGLGIFAMLDQLLGKGEPQARHCRDLVALGLVGGGLNDKTADKLVDDMPPSENHKIRAMAQDLLLAAFLPPEDKKKADDLVGSSAPSAPTNTKRQTKSKAPSAPV